MILTDSLRAKILNIENKSLNNQFPYKYLKKPFKLIRKKKYDDSFESIKKFYNDTKNYKFEPKLHVDSAKVKIQNLETNNTCNLNCPMCDTRSQTRKKINLEIENLDKIIQLAVKRNKENKQQRTNDNIVSFHTVGEPILSPYLEDYLKILKKYNFKLSLSTNGILIDRKLDILCKYAEQIADIIFSLLGVSHSKVTGSSAIFSFRLSTISNLFVWSSIGFIVISNLSLVVSSCCNQS